LKGAFENIILHRSVTDHAIFVRKEHESKIFVAITTNDSLCLVDNCAQFLRLKSRMEELFDMTFQEGATVRFLNLRVIKSPQGIIIDHTAHIVDTIIDTYFVNRDLSKLVPITSPFPTNSQFERDLYDSPILTGSKLHTIEKQYGGSLFHWNGILLHVAITIRVDLGYAIMRISGYLAAPTEVILKALDHTMRYLYFYQHMQNFHPRRPLSKKALAMHWSKGSAEFLSLKYGTILVNSADADHARDIRDRRSVSLGLHLLNHVVVSWKCKKQATTTLHSIGSEILSLASEVKKTIHLRDFLASVGYPICDTTSTFEDNQGTITSIKASRLHKNTCHLYTHISWLNKHYVMGIIKLLYTKISLQLSDINTKPLCGHHFQAIFTYGIGVLHYPASDSQHYQYLYLEVCRLLDDYIKNGKQTPVSKD
jgi:hypothetical protein